MKHKQNVPANQSSGCQIECAYLQMSIGFTALHLNILDSFKPESCRGSKYYAARRLLRDKI